MSSGDHLGYDIVVNSKSTINASLSFWIKTRERQTTAVTIESTGFLVAQHDMSHEFFFRRRLTITFDDSPCAYQEMK